MDILFGKITFASRVPAGGPARKDPRVGIAASAPKRAAWAASSIGIGQECGRAKCSCMGLFSAPGAVTVFAASRRAAWRGNKKPRARRGMGQEKTPLGAGLPRSKRDH